MNFSLSSLVLRNVFKSPLFSIPSAKQIFNLKNSYFSQFSFPTFFIQTNLNVKKTKFKHFTSPVLLSNLDYIYKTGTFSEQQIFTNPNGIQFDCCTFSNVNSQENSAIYVSNEKTSFATRFCTFSQITTGKGCLFLNCITSKIISTSIQDSTSSIGSFINCQNTANNALIFTSGCSFIGKQQQSEENVVRDSLSLNSSQIVIFNTNTTNTDITGWGAFCGIIPHSYVSMRNNVIDKTKGQCIFWCSFLSENVEQSFYNLIFSNVECTKSICWTDSKLEFESCFFGKTGESGILFEINDNIGQYTLIDCQSTTSITNNEQNYVITQNFASNQQMTSVESITFQVIADCKPITRSLLPTRTLQPTRTLLPSPTFAPTDRTKARTPYRTPMESPVASPVPTPAISPVPTETPTASASPWPSPRYVPLFGFTSVLSFFLCVVVFFIIFCYRELFEKSSSSTIHEREPHFKYNKISSSSEWDENCMNLSSDPGSDIY